MSGRLLFLCVGNSARSQMAEAILEERAPGAFEVESAGTNPSTVHPLTIAALAEERIDWSAARSKPVTEFLGQAFDVVVTVCDEAREACPVFPGARHALHWSFEDPAAAIGSDAERMAVFRRVRDEIDARIERALEDGELDVG